MYLFGSKGIYKDTNHSETTDQSIPFGYRSNYALYLGITLQFPFPFVRDNQIKAFRLWIIITNIHDHQGFYCNTLTHQQLVFFIRKWMYTHTCVYLFSLYESMFGIQPLLCWIIGWWLPNLEGVVAFYRLFVLFGVIFFLNRSNMQCELIICLTIKNKSLRKYFLKLEALVKKNTR